MKTRYLILFIVAALFIFFFSTGRLDNFRLSPDVKESEVDFDFLLAVPGAHNFVFIPNYLDLPQQIVKSAPTCNDAMVTLKEEVLKCKRLTSPSSTPPQDPGSSSPGGCLLGWCLQQSVAKAMGVCCDGNPANLGQCNQLKDIMASLSADLCANCNTPLASQDEPSLSPEFVSGDEISSCQQAREQYLNSGETCRNADACIQTTCVFDKARQFVYACCASEKEGLCREASEALQVHGSELCRDCKSGCPAGTQLCADGSCKAHCETQQIPCRGNSPNGICDQGESCACSDCNNQKDSCTLGALCSNGRCCYDKSVCEKLRSVLTAKCQGLILDPSHTAQECTNLNNAIFRFNDRCGSCWGPMDMCTCETQH